MSEARFSMGQLVITTRAKGVLHPQDLQQSKACDCFPSIATGQRSSFTTLPRPTSSISGGCNTVANKIIPDGSTS